LLTSAPSSLLQSTSPSPSIVQTPVPPPISAPSQSTQSLPSSPRIGATLGALSSKPLTSRTNTGSHGLRTVSIPPPPISSSTFASTSSHIMGPPTQNAQPNLLGSSLSSQSSPQPQRSSFPKPNYNSSFAGIPRGSEQRAPHTVSFMAPASQLNQLRVPNVGSAFSAPAMTAAFSTPASPPRQAMGDILTPLKPQQRSSLSGVSTNKPTSKDILSDFDPLA
jgi:hypothetical protein